MNWYFEVWKKFAVFEGRARRKEYWTWALINFLISVVIFLIETEGGRYTMARYEMGPLSMIFSLACIIPGLAVSVRRLHDTNRSGLFLFLLFIPLVGALVVLFFMVQEGQAEENQYGPNPKAAEVKV